MPASLVSSKPAASMRLRSSVPRATTTLESTPPDRYETTGTSARRRRSTARISTASKSSANCFFDFGSTSWPASG